MTCACHVKRYATERAWCASCSCGWRTARTDRDRRDANADRHLDHDDRGRHDDQRADQKETTR